MKSLLLTAAVIALFNSPRAPVQDATSFTISQAVIDNIESAAEAKYDVILVISDSIEISEDITIHGLSLTMICDRFISGDKKLTILPNKKTDSEFDNGKGRHGKTITIYSRSAVRGHFILPGSKGDSGKRGKDGKWGSKTFEKKEETTHPGQQGENGQDGFRGGNGGLLRIYSMAPKAEMNVTLEGPPGTGGRGGGPGIGGWTYQQISRAPRPNQEKTPGNAIYEIRNQQEDNGKPGKTGALGLAPIYQFMSMSDSAYFKEREKYGITEENKSEFPPVSLIGGGARKTFNFSGNEAADPGRIRR